MVKDIFNFLIYFGVGVIVVRIIEMIFSMLRIKYLRKNNRKKLFMYSFIDIFIWVVFSSTAISSGNTYQLLGYCVGYFIGVYIGVSINDKTSDDSINLVRLFIKNEDVEIVDEIRKHGFGATVIKVNQNKGDNYLVMINSKKSAVSNLLTIINNYNNKTFVVINNTYDAMNGYINILNK